MPWMWMFFIMCHTFVQFYFCSGYVVRWEIIQHIRIYAAYIMYDAHKHTHTPRNTLSMYIFISLRLALFYSQYGARAKQHSRRADVHAKLFYFWKEKKKNSTAFHLKSAATAQSHTSYKTHTPHRTLP